MELVIVLIIIIIPVIVILSFIGAIIWGFVKAKNPKRYFITLGCVVGVISFFVSTAFIDYESEFVNAFTFQKIPAEYSDYRYLQDTVTTDYTIKKLDGRFVEQMFVDSITSNFIVVTRNEGSEWKEFYHRIDSTGHLIGSFTRPEDQCREGRYLIGPDNYCDWIITGDTLSKAYTPINGVQSRESLLQRYEKADFVRFRYDSICILHVGDTWYSCKIDFRPKGYADDEKYKEKSGFAEAHLNDKKFNVLSRRDTIDMYNDWPIEFKDCPATSNDGALQFESFAKQEYYSGFSSPFSGIGSPTGGNSHSACWYGTGFCKLRVGDKYIPFACDIEHSLGHWESYSTDFTIYTGDNYAIFSGKYRTYMISTQR